MAAPSLFILQCNTHRNEADKFLSRRKGLRANPQHVPLSAARNARGAVKSLYLPERIPGFAKIALQAFARSRE
jgi:hypothetical protein